MLEDAETRITRENFPEFKKLYRQADAEKQPQFVFKGQPVLTKYAMYAIQYIEKELKYKMTEK